MQVETYLRLVCYLKDAMRSYVHAIDSSHNLRTNFQLQIRITLNKTREFTDMAFYTYLCTSFSVARISNTGSPLNLSTISGMNLDVAKKLHPAISSKIRYVRE